MVSCYERSSIIKYQIYFFVIEKNNKIIIVGFFSLEKRFLQKIYVILHRRNNYKREREREKKTIIKKCILVFTGNIITIREEKH